MDNESTEQRFSWWLVLRLCTFQIGSAMGDILVTSIWNRVMIVNFGFPALPIGLLIALRYLISPLSLYAGFRSDTSPLFGYRRTPYIWLGRGLMVLSFPLLGLSVMRFAATQNDALGWVVAIFSFLLYGTGTLLSGSPFLALVRDSVPKAKQGLAASVVETALIVMFAVVGIGFSLVLREFTVTGFWELVLASMLIGGFFWFFAIVGVETRAAASANAVKTKTREQYETFRATFTRIWRDPRPRAFALFLLAATAAAWLQEAILEPFGAEVLNQSLAQTTRYSSYWQSATALVLVLIPLALGAPRLFKTNRRAAAWLARTMGKLFRDGRPEQQSRSAKFGLALMGLGMLLLGLTALSAQSRVLAFALVVYGVGFGVYTFGGFSLLIAMTTDREAGAYLGLWSVTILLSRGLGILLGGALRDAFYGLTLAPPLAYGVVFGFAALGLWTAIWLLHRVNVLSFARDTGRAAAVADIGFAPIDL